MEDSAATSSTPLVAASDAGGGDGRGQGMAPCASPLSLLRVDAAEGGAIDGVALPFPPAVPSLGLGAWAWRSSLGTTSWQNYLVWLIKGLLGNNLDPLLHLKICEVIRGGGTVVASSVE